MLRGISRSSYYSRRARSFEKGSGRRATVVEGNGFEATVIFTGSDQPKVVAPYQVFSHYVEDDVEIEFDWLDARGHLCRKKKGDDERLARERQARDAMDVERAQGVQVRRDIRTEGGQRRDWRAPDPNDPRGRCDFDKVADAYADRVAASEPQEDDYLTGRQVCFRVRHTSRCPPVAW